MHNEIAPVQQRAESRAKDQGQEGATAFPDKCPAIRLAKRQAGGPGIVS
jgi:hypothetical protein